MLQIVKVNAVTREHISLVLYGIQEKSTRGKLPHCMTSWSIRGRFMGPFSEHRAMSIRLPFVGVQFLNMGRKNRCVSGAVKLQECVHLNCYTWLRFLRLC
jgi:hypothetical protein